MKRLLTLLCALLLVTSLSAQRSQRIAVFEFEPGANISKDMVDGLSSMFITFFQPNGWSCVDRIEIDQIVSEQNFQQSKITESQRTKIGRAHNISKMVLGTINIANGQYNVDVRVVDVTTGEISATEGISIRAQSVYRTAIETLAKNLAKKVEDLPVIESEVRERADVEIVMDYLKVYPEELGEYPYEPTTVINQINLQHRYDYDSWRIPSDTELALLRNNGYLDDEKTYISSSSHSSDGIVLLVTDATETYSQKQARLEAQRASKRKKDTASAITINPFTEKPEQPIDALKADMENIHQQSELTMMLDLDFAYKYDVVLGSSFTIGRTYKERLFLGIGVGYYRYWMGIEKNHYDCYGNSSYFCPSDCYHIPLSYIPLFAHSRFYFKNTHVHLTKNFKGHPYLTLSLGASPTVDYSCVAFYFNSHIGVDFPLYNKLAFYLNVGVETIPTCYIKYDGADWDNDCCKIGSVSCYNSDRGGAVHFSAKIGLRF